MAQKKMHLEHPMDRLLWAFRIESRVLVRTQNGAQEEFMEFESKKTKTSDSNY